MIVKVLFITSIITTIRSINNVNINKSEEKYHLIYLIQFL